jgi:hypothetical protein
LGESSKRFYRIRVGILLAILGVVILYAIANVRSRRARNEWERPLNVAIVIVRDGNVDAAAIEAVRARVSVLEEKLTSELHRYRSTPAKPFYFVVHGPVDSHAPRPTPASEHLVDLAKHAYALSRWVGAVDDALRTHGSAYDARVYVVMHPPTDARLRYVEGNSEQGGRIGTLEVDLDASMVDFALFVTAHELFHTLGALDKYDDTGHTKIPEGLAEPDAPLPQELAEVMARGRPIAPGRDEPPDNLDRLRVNAITAREIGWLRAP